MYHGTGSVVQLGFQVASAGRAVTGGISAMLVWNELKECVAP